MAASVPVKLASGVTAPWGGGVSTVMKTTVSKPRYSLAGGQREDEELRVDAPLVVKPMRAVRGDVRALTVKIALVAPSEMD